MNPWGLSAHTARVMDALVAHDDHKGAAKAIGCTLSTLRGASTRARKAMGLGPTHSKHLILWDRFRREYTEPEELRGAIATIARVLERAKVAG